MTHLPLWLKPGAYVYHRNPANVAARTIFAVVKVQRERPSNPRHLRLANALVLADGQIFHLPLENGMHSSKVFLNDGGECYRELPLPKNLETLEMEIIRCPTPRPGTKPTKHSSVPAAM
jgi:hypothetical protein